MPTDINFDPFAEGDAVAAADITSRFTAIENGINGLTNYSIADKAFGSSKLPSLTGVCLGTSNFTATSTLTETGVPGLLYPAGTNVLELELADVTLGQASPDFVTAVLVLANVFFQSAYDPVTIGLTTDTWGFYALEYRTVAGGAVWFRHTPSERFIANVGTALANATFQDVSIRALFTAADMATLSAVRIVAGYYRFASDTGMEVVTLRGNLTAIGLYGKEPV